MAYWRTLLIDVISLSNRVPGVIVAARTVDHETVTAAREAEPRKVAVFITAPAEPGSLTLTGLRGLRLTSPLALSRLN